jgi:energy-coupling factor transport system permease protein
MPLVWVIFYPAGELLVGLWIIQIPLLSLFRGLAVVFRIYAVTLAVLALLYTTDQPALIRGLEKLRLPYRWGLVLSLTFRYIPALQLTFDSILQAQRARGLEYESKRGIGRVRALMPVFIPMVITTLRDSEQMGIALEARGFGAQATQRTHYKDVFFRSSDWAYLAIGIVMSATLLFLNIEYGFGVDPLRPLP